MAHGEAETKAFYYTQAVTSWAKLTVQSSGDLSQRNQARAGTGTVHNSQDMETTQMSIDRWVGEEDVNTCNKMLLSHKKEWNNAICDNRDAARDYHTKWNKSERESQAPYDITYMWNLKENTKELIYKTVLCVLNPFSGVQLCVTLWTLPRQDPLSVGFSRQE